MLTDRKRNPAHSRHVDTGDRIVFSLLLSIAYPVCLLSAISRRMFGMFRDGSPQSGESVFTEARSAAYAAVGYAFQA